MRSTPLVSIKSLLLSFALAACDCGGTPPPPDSGDDAGVHADASDARVEAPLDADGDGVDDAREQMLGTSPNDADTDDDGLSDGDELIYGADPLVPDTDADGVPDGLEVSLGTDPVVADSACGTRTIEATLTYQPTDIIIVVDNSESTDDEIEGIIENIDESFAAILDASPVDYRIILISAFGKPWHVCTEQERFEGEPSTCDPAGNADRLICITSPLSSTSCDPVPSSPAFGPRFFHYDAAISSSDSLDQLLATYDEDDSYGNAPGGWRHFLREGARRVILEITDDRTYMSANGFEDALFALDPPLFGTSAEDRAYVFHAIIGGTPKADVNVPYEADEPAVGAACATAAAPSATYEQLAMRTGGLRFPVCEIASYDSVFHRIAEGIVTGSVLACELDLPAAAPGMTLDIARSVIVYQRGDGSDAENFAYVDGASACTAASFYREGDSLVLCDAVCDRIRYDIQAELDLLVPCEFVIE